MKFLKTLNQISKIVSLRVRALAFGVFELRNTCIALMSLRQNSETKGGPKKILSKK